jgi:hypothetical protein
VRRGAGIALAALALLVAPGPRRAPAAPAPVTVDFIFSGDLAGYLEPCG